MMKEYILDNNYIPTILENLGCHHIRNNGSYYTCGNPDGDNPNSITVYPNSNISVIDYTRDLSNKKSNDIIDLAEYFLQESFFKTLKQICEWIDLDYYKDWDEDVPESIKITKLIFEIQEGDTTQDEMPLKPISEHILSYYYPFVNDLFKRDNISYETQRLFEIGYDDFSNRITIPIRDELGNLVGVKGRLFKEQLDEDDSKYLYIERCNRSQILYGLYYTYNSIKTNNSVYVCESEKGTMQLVDMGITNVVSTGGSKVSQMQIDKLTRLCVPIIFCFDQDISQWEIEELADRFIDGTEIYALIDNPKSPILSKKESPSDDPVKFKELNEHCKVRVK